MRPGWTRPSRRVFSGSGGVLRVGKRKTGAALRAPVFLFWDRVRLAESEESGEREEYDCSGTGDPRRSLQRRLDLVETTAALETGEARLPRQCQADRRRCHDGAELVPPADPNL